MTTPLTVEYLSRHFKTSMREDNPYLRDVYMACPAPTHEFQLMDGKDCLFWDGDKGLEAKCLTYNCSGDAIFFGLHRALSTMRARDTRISWLKTAHSLLSARYVEERQGPEWVLIEIRVESKHELLWSLAGTGVLSRFRPRWTWSTRAGDDPEAVTLRPEFSKRGSRRWTLEEIDAYLRRMDAEAWVYGKRGMVEEHKAHAARLREIA